MAWPAAARNPETGSWKKQLRLEGAEEHRRFGMDVLALGYLFGCCRRRRDGVTPGDLAAIHHPQNMQASFVSFLFFRMFFSFFFFSYLLPSLVSITIP